MKIQVGHHWIRYKNWALIARWDGLQWHHEHGVTSPEQEHTNVIITSAWQRLRNIFGYTVHPLSYTCQTGCTCTTNPDGTQNIHCT